MTCDPVPKPIGGKGNTQIIAPASMDAPNKTAATIITIIPANMTTKPKRNSLNGVGHGKDSDGEVSWVRLL